MRWSLSGIDKQVKKKESYHGSALSSIILVYVQKISFGLKFKTKRNLYLLTTRTREINHE